MIGAFGGIVFETSDRRILTLKGVSRQSQTRYATHDIIGQKPRQEYTGPGLGQLSFTIDLSAAYGVDVEEETEKWRNMVELGTVSALIVGEEMIGGLWIVKSLSESWGVVLKDGTIYNSSINVTLEEYGGVAAYMNRRTSKGIKREGAVLTYPQEPEEESFTGVVLPRALNVRKGAGWSFDVAYTLSKGNLVNIVGQGNGWYQLEDGNYASARNISR